MDITDINPAGFIAPPGTEQVVFARDQPEYEPLPALLTPDGKVVSQWKPSVEELAAIAAGAPITLVVWTFNHAPQPVYLGVGAINIT